MEIKTSVSVDVKNVLHIGGFHAEEAVQYVESGAERIVFVEAMPEMAKISRQHTEQFENVTTLCACCADVTGKTVDFRVTNNGCSSSLLRLKEHKRIHPSVVETRVKQMETITVDDLLRVSGFKAVEFDFVCIDVQGAELLVLKGMTERIKAVRCLAIEINLVEVYEGCVLLPELNAYLDAAGFRAAMTRMWEGYGDAVYLREAIKS